MTTYQEILTAAGFEPDEDARSWIGEMAEALRMTANGPYIAHECWTKPGGFAVTIEQTTFTGDDIGTIYPKVIVFDFPGGRVAIDPRDLDALSNELALVTA